jgi:hypothetical protein
VSTQGPNPQSLIDSYIDDALTPAQRHAFEQQLRASPALAEQIELQHRIDDSLRRLFAVPSAPSLPAIIVAPAPQDSPSLSFMRRYGLYIAAAAAILLAFGFLLINLQPAPPPLRPYIIAKTTLRGQYQAELNAGFEPAVVCTTPDQFQEWVDTNFQQSLRPAETSEAIRLVGWSYSPIVSNYSGILLAFVDDQPVVVVLDRLDRLDNPPNTGEGPQHIFEKQVNGLILYEITPFDQPRILPLLE